MTSLLSPMRRNGRSVLRNGSAALLPFAAMLLTLGSLAAPAEARAQSSNAPRYRVIVNSSNPVSTLSRQEASALFLKKKPKWQSGDAVMPVDLPEDAATRDAFSREVLGKPTTAVKAFWQQMIFSGRNVPPPERRTDDDVIAYVRSTPGAIGYISGAGPVWGVKVVSIGS